jgi:CubicO group peptidase (beta-lactamase class C family)
MKHGTVIEQPQLLTLDTMFDLASLTKMYATNYALMHLVDQGALNVDDPVKKYIPQYCGCNPENECRDTRLIKDLLTHTAGYAPSVKFYDPRSVSPDLYSQDKQKTEQIIETKLGFQRPRGDDQLPIYSDIDYMLLGLIVEHVSGMPIDQYVTVNIYQRLGLTHTLLNPLNNADYHISDFAATELNGNTRNGTINFPNIRTHVLQGQVHDENSFYSMNGLSGHVGLFSNLHDMTILTQIMLNKGTYGNIQFWSKNVQDLFLIPYALDPTFGLG